LDSSESGGTKRISGFRSLFSGSSSAPVIDRQRRVTLASGSAPPAIGLLGGKEKDGKESHAAKSQTLNAPPSSYSQRSSLSPSPTKEIHGANGNGAGAKRSSYLGRLVKKFSTIRHNTEPGVGDNVMGKRRDLSPSGFTPPNSAGPVADGQLKRSASTANVIFPKPEADTAGLGGGHPKFASAPAETVENPILNVPELRLVGVQEDPLGGTEVPGNGMGGMGSPSSPIDSPIHRQQQEQQNDQILRRQQQQKRPLSDGRNSPEPQIAGLQFGGLVITNPDVRASAASATDADVGGKEGGSEYDGSPMHRIRRVEASPPPVGGMHAPPRPAFMRNAGAGFVGATSSAESSPNVNYTPLRVVNGREETETETETEVNGKGLRDIPSPISPASTLPVLPSPRRTLYSENGSHAQLLLSAIPSIPDLPSISPFNPARSLNGGETDSPRSDSMETALEFMSPPVSSLSINRPPLSTSRAVSNHSLAKPDEGSPARKPSPDQRQQQQRPLSITSSGTTKASSVAGSIPASTSSTSTNATSSTATTTKPPTNDTATSTIKLATNVSDYDYETAIPPPARRRAPSSAATVATAPGSDGQGGGGSRFGAYYSPGTFPSLAIPPGTPQQPGSQRHSLLSLENNPLPTPPARLPIPLLSENGSREMLRTESGSAERPRPLSGAENSNSERLRAQSQSGSTEREKLKGSSSKERLNSQKSKETVRDTREVRDSREVRSSPSGRFEAPSSSSSRSISSNVVDLSFSPRSTPTFDRPGSRDKRSDREAPSYGWDKEADVVKERRNQSTFRIPGESSDSRPSSRDPPSSSASSATAGTGSGARERTRSASKETLNAGGANPSRSRVESGSYDVTSSRPVPKQTNSYHSTASSLRDSDPEAEARRKRTNSSGMCICVYADLIGY
jgi:hypothetical protein